MTRTLLVVVALAAVGLAVWKLVGSAPRWEALEPPTVAEPRSEEPEDPFEVAEPERAPAREARTAPSGTGAPVEVDPDEELPFPTRRLQGTLIVEDEQGAERALESGSFSLVFWHGWGGQGFEVAVEEGRWRAEVPSDVELSVGQVEAGGRPAVLLAPQGRFAPPEDGALALRARWFRAGTLAVLDAATQEHLGDVTLVRALPWPREEYPHPGDVDAARVLVEHAASPLALPTPEAARAVVHVGAPGHAWTRLELDALEGGERVVALGPGAGLELELALGRIDPGAVVRVRSAGLVVAELDLAARERFRLEGLPPGPARASVEIGDWWDEARVLAAGEVELVAGATATLRLAVEDAPLAPAVPFGGVVVVPPEWELERFLLVIELLDPPLGGRAATARLNSAGLAAVAGEPGAYRWSLPDAQAGRYELLLFQLMHSISLELGPNGDEDVRFEVPPPGAIEVRVVNDATGLPAEVEHVFWNCERPEGVSGGGLQRAEPTGEPGRWRIRAPQGRVEIDAGGGGWRGASERVELGDAPLEVELRVARQQLLKVLLRDGATRVPWESGGIALLRRAGAEDARRVWVGGGEALVVPLDAPGTYELELPELAAYAPIPVQEILVGDAPETEHVIELVRRR